MGDWLVLKWYNSGPDGPGSYGDGDLTRGSRFHNCDWPSDFGCERVVKQHQKWKFEPEVSDVPEFTIEVAYKTHDHVGNAVTPGWRYILKWMENGSFKQVRNYGFIDKDAAVQAAKYEARNIARALTPVHVETYTPEV